MCQALEIGAGSRSKCPALLELRSGQVGIWTGILRSEVGLYDIRKEFWEILGKKAQLRLGSGNMEMTRVAWQSTYGYRFL